MKLLEKLIGMSVSIAFIAIGQFPLHSCTRSNKHMLNVNERVILANNKVITYQVLTEKEFIHLTGGGYYEMLSNYLSKSILVYKTNSGLLYFNDEGRCGVFNNISDLNSYVALKSEKHGSTQILFQKNRYGEHFPLHIDALKKELLDTLHIDGGQTTPKMLLEIDNKINHLGDAMAFRERYFLNIGAADFDFFHIEDKI